MNFYYILLVIPTVDYAEFHEGLMTETIEQCIAVNLYNRLSVILTVNCCEFVLITVSHFDGELWGFYLGLKS